MTTVRSDELVARERMALQDRVNDGFVEIVKMYENFSSEANRQKTDALDALRKEVVEHFLVSAE